MPRYQVLAIDIDGTLVNSNDELTPATREALGRAGKAGIHVVLATGRRYSRTLHLVEPLGIDVPMIRAAGLGVAMGNAKPEVKAAADRIAPSHDEDGLVEVVRWLL